MDPAKLKVVELRSELANRGLDTKGNKAVLVDRLKEALDKEAAEGGSAPIVSEPPATGDLSQQEMDDKDDEHEDEGQEKMDTEEGPSQLEKNEKDDEEEHETVDEPQNEVEKKENGEDNTANEDKNNKTDLQEQKEEKTEEENKSTESPDKRGEKRKRTPSPNRGGRRKSRSPVKEDEPIIDYDKVQLNWYDSDLHLQIDKETFMTAKPYHDGAFGYVWAGVRATHGIDSGKVCFEVKVTEELKWEDVIKQPERGRRDRDNRRKYDKDGKHSSKHDERKKDKSRDRKSNDKEKVANGKDEETGDKKSEEKEAEETVTESTEKTEPPVEVAKEDSVKEGGETESQEKMEITESSKGEDTTEKKENVEETCEKKAEKVEETVEKKAEKVEEEAKEPPSEPITPHLIRVGWSIISAGLQLGEEKYSYAYESSSKFITDKEFADYGIKFGVGDVVGSYVEFGDENISITFSVNGVAQATAVTIPREGLPEGFSLFPHVLSKNFAFEVNLGNKDEAFFPLPENLSDYVYLDKVEDMIAGPMRPEKRNDCEVIMMCGLPASGKTYWVKEFIEKNPDKRYTVIGNTQLLEKMTVNGKPLKESFKDRWSMVLDKLQRCLNKLTDIASVRRRNYIIDQTNVFPFAQRRKMRSFEGFKRRAVVVVVGDEEQTKRQQLKEAQDGKDVPTSALLDMKANMSLPKVGDWIEEVEFVGLEEEEAKTTVQKYNTQGREAGFGPNNNPNWKKFRDNRKPPRWQDRRTDFYRGGYKDYHGHNGRYESRGGRPGWYDSRSGRGGNWNRDRRDRGPPSRDWHNNNRGGGGGGRGRDFDHGVRDGRISRNQRIGGSGGYSGNRSHGGGGRQGGGAPWQGGWGGQAGNWGQGNWNMLENQYHTWDNQEVATYHEGQGQYKNTSCNWTDFSQFNQSQQNFIPQNMWNSQGDTSNGTINYTYKKQHY